MSTLRIYPCKTCHTPNAMCRPDTQCPACHTVAKIEINREYRARQRAERDRARAVLLDPAIALYRAERARNQDRVRDILAIAAARRAESNYQPTGAVA